MSKEWNPVHVEVIDMYVTKVGLAAKGKYFSSLNFEEIVDCLKGAYGCLSRIKEVSKDVKIDECPDETSHRNCFCETEI